jgi:seryl-tRNA synthetase
MDKLENVEQFWITSPHGDEKDRIHKEMINNGCNFLKSVGIPFSVVLVVSSEFNYSTSISYDIKGWFPSYVTCRELVSGSNCRDFQSRRLAIRYGHGTTEGRDKEFVHMLNCTPCATEETFCAILENSQTSEGICVPNVIQPYMRDIVAVGEAGEEFSNQPDIGLQAAAEALVLETQEFGFIPFVRVGSKQFPK